MVHSKIANPVHELAGSRWQHLQIYSCWTCPSEPAFGLHVNAMRNMCCCFGIPMSKHHLLGTGGPMTHGLYQHAWINFQLHSPAHHHYSPRRGELATHAFDHLSPAWAKAHLWAETYWISKPEASFLFSLSLSLYIYHIYICKLQLWFIICAVGILTIR